MATERRSGPGRNSSGLGRDIEILELLGGPESVTNGGLGVSRVAEVTGRDKAVISRALATLADVGLVTRNGATRSYRLGPRLFALAARTREAALVAESRPYLRWLARHTGETTHLCVLRGGNVLTLVSELSPYDIRTSSWEGVTTAAWRTPSGWVLLSDWSATELSAWYEDHGHDLAVLTDPATLTMVPTTTFAPAELPDRQPVHDLSSLLEVTHRIRSQGYATSDEEFELGVVAASAPVFDYTGTIAAAINVSAPKARIGERLDTLGRFVARAAEPLSRQMGGTPTVKSDQDLPVAEPDAP